MSSMTDKAKGLADKAGGEIKQGTGKLVGDEELQAKGKAQVVKGGAEETVGDAKQKVSGAINAATDEVDRKG